MDADVLRTLYGGPPTGFVAARDALVKELRGRGERDSAAEVKRLRRHDPVEWTLNRAAHLHPDLVAAFVQAAVELRDVQAAAVEGRAGGDVRAATAALRERQGALVDAARRLEHAPPAADLAARLLELAPDETATTQLHEGVLGASELAPLELFAGLTPPQQTPRSRDRETTRTVGPRRSTATRAEPAPAPTPSSNRAAERRALRERVRQARDAERVAQAAVRCVDRRVREARDAVDEATQRLRHAERHLAELQRELDDEQAALDAAAAALGEAEHALDQV